MLSQPPYLHLESFLFSKGLLVVGGNIRSAAHLLKSRQPGTEATFSLFRISPNPFESLEKQISFSPLSRPPSQQCRSSEAQGVHSACLTDT